MKFNWRAYLRMFILSYILISLLMIAGYGSFVCITVAMLIGFFYPEKVITLKDEKNADDEN